MKESPVQLHNPALNKNIFASTNTIFVMHQTLILYSAENVKLADKRINVLTVVIVRVVM